MGTRTVPPSAIFPRTLVQMIERFPSNSGSVIEWQHASLQDGNWVDCSPESVIPGLTYTCCC